MKVKFNVPARYDGKDRDIGYVVDVSDAEAEKLKRLNIADPIRETKPKAGKEDNDGKKVS